MPAGREDVFAEILVVALAGQVLEDECGEQDAVGRIGGQRAGRAEPDDPVAQEAREVLRLAAIELPPRQLVESAGVGQEMPQRQRRKSCRRHLQTLQVAIDVGVEVRPPVVHELQHGHRRDRLRDRGDRPHRARRVDLPAAREIRDAVSARMDDPAPWTKTNAAPGVPVALSSDSIRGSTVAATVAARSAWAGVANGERDEGDPGEIHPSVERTKIRDGHPIAG